MMGIIFFSRNVFKQCSSDTSVENKTKTSSRGGVTFCGCVTVCVVIVLVVGVKEVPRLIGIMV